MNKFSFSIELLWLLQRQKKHSAQQRHKKALVMCRQAEKELQDAAVMLEAGRYLVEWEQVKGITDKHLATLRNSCLAMEIRWRERQVELIEARRVADSILKEILAIKREGEALNRFLDRDHLADWQSVRLREQKLFKEITALVDVDNDVLSVARFKHGLPAIAGRHSDQRLE